MGQLADKVKEVEAQLVRAQAVINQQEAMFAGEKERLAPYFGHGLERLTRADLEALNSFHYKAINRLQPLLVRFAAFPGCCMQHASSTFNLNVHVGLRSCV